jgi:hypothetical protein
MSNILANVNISFKSIIDFKKVRCQRTFQLKSEYTWANDAQINGLELQIAGFILQNIGQQGFKELSKMIHEIRNTPSPEGDYDWYSWEYFEIYNKMSVYFDNLGIVTTGLNELRGFPSKFLIFNRIAKAIRPN